MKLRLKTSQLLRGGRVANWASGRAHIGKTSGKLLAFPFWRSLFGCSKATMAARIKHDVINRCVWRGWKFERPGAKGGGRIPSAVFDRRATKQGAAIYDVVYKSKFFLRKFVWPKRGLERILGFRRCGRNLSRRDFGTTSFGLNL